MTPTLLPVRLVFADWQDRDGKSVYNTEEGAELSMGKFHAGTTFEGAIALEYYDAKELADAMASGNVPVFEVMPAK